MTSIKITIKGNALKMDNNNQSRPVGLRIIVRVNMIEVHNLFLSILIAQLNSIRFIDKQAWQCWVNY